MAILPILNYKSTQRKPFSIPSQGRNCGKDRYLIPICHAYWFFKALLGCVGRPLSGGKGCVRSQHGVLMRTRQEIQEEIQRVEKEISSLQAKRMRLLMEAGAAETEETCKDCGRKEESCMCCEVA